MRALVLVALSLTMAAGCATTAPPPAEAPASADALAEYLRDRGLAVSPTVTDGPAVEGAGLATFALGEPTFVSSRPRRTGDRDFDARSPWHLGVRSSEAYAYTHTRARGAAPPLLWVYAFDGPADLARVRAALGPSLADHALYVGGSLVVIPASPARSLVRTLEAAFGPARTL